MKNESKFQEKFWFDNNQDVLVMKKFSTDLFSALKFFHAYDFSFNGLFTQKDIVSHVTYEKTLFFKVVFQQEYLNECFFF